MKKVTGSPMEKFDAETPYCMVTGLIQKVPDDISKLPDWKEACAKLILCKDNRIHRIKNSFVFIKNNFRFTYTDAEIIDEVC